MTRRGVFSVLTGFIAGLFGTARAGGASSNIGTLSTKAKEWIETDRNYSPIGPGKSKDIKRYYLSYFVPDKNNGHYKLIPFFTEHRAIINVMEQRIGWAQVVGRSFDSWVPRILSKEDIDSNAFVDNPRLAGYERWTSKECP